MKVGYDEKVDTAFIRFSSKRPVGGVEIKEGVILHVTEKDKIVALEILDASQRVPLQNLFKLEVLKVAGQGKNYPNYNFLCRAAECVTGVLLG